LELRVLAAPGAQFFSLSKYGLVLYGDGILQFRSMSSRLQKFDAMRESCMIKQDNARICDECTHADAAPYR
jgi:hypothetical protein